MRPLSTRPLEGEEAQPVGGKVDKEVVCTFEYPSLRQAERGPCFAIARIGEAILIKEHWAHEAILRRFMFFFQSPSSRVLGGGLPLTIDGRRLASILENMLCFCVLSALLNPPSFLPSFLPSTNHQQTIPIIFRTFWTTRLYTLIPDVTVLRLTVDHAV
ncbi:hypothetical protein O988_00962 [Pseudogymnoascus sp. VKM F-3808]|nr:hypothetical protein O988_00962 [Pseudogymnoascus sp. VKM F-3808]